MGPESILNQSRASLLAPIPNFVEEISLITPPSSPPAAAPRLDDRTFSYPGAEDFSALGDADDQELHEILSNLPAERSEQARRSYYDRQDPTRPLSEDLPEDVRLYIEGARLFSQDKKAEALDTWKRLLDLPAEQRRNRSTRAAWMIARTLRQDGDAQAAQPWYALCSKLAGDGYRDCLKLGLSSLGWQARYALDQGDYPKALGLYYHQALAGDPTGWNSLRRALPDPEKLSTEQLKKFAEDPFLRGLMTTSLLRESFDYYTPPDEELSPHEPRSKWLTALESANIDSLAEAVRFAELAYSNAEFAMAERWLKKSAPDDPCAAWLRGKLALMNGRTEEAEKYLQQATRAYPRSLGTAEPTYLDSSLSYIDVSTLALYRINQLYGDLAIAALARDHYPAALTALYQGGFLDDATYVSERLLRSDELLTYTQKWFPEPAADPQSPPDVLSESARYLLARRLAREGRFEEALPFYPPAIRPLFDYYSALRKKAAAFSVFKEPRASALWEAAQFHRKLGMELFGTEGHPDYANYQGSGEGTAYFLTRLNVDFQNLPEDDWSKQSRPIKIVPAPTSNERARALASRLPHEERFQYRYVAADLAWEAAGLMPNNSEETARTLGIAGRWLEWRDPKAADRFYKALIWRNWSTSLARQADAKRWFPEIPWDYDPYAAADVPRPE